MAQEPLPPQPGSDAVDEHPQRRRTWKGAFRSVILPVLAVAAIGASIWYLEYRPSAAQEDDPTFGIVDISQTPGGPSFEAQEGRQAPDFFLQATDGSTVRLSDLRGKGVIINFWATWCAPCRQEMPELVSAYDRYKESGLEILAVNLQESVSKVTSFADEYGVQFPVLLDRDCDVTDEYRVTTDCRVAGVPTSFFIDPDGIVRSTFLGPLQGGGSRSGIEQSELDKRIQEILPQNYSGG